VNQLADCSLHNAKEAQRRKRRRYSQVLPPATSLAQDHPARLVTG
jgi:hypothetical protein